MSTKSLISRLERLESQLLPPPEDTALADTMKAIMQDMARAGERMRAEHPEWFEPGGPAVMPLSTGWGASKRFIRELTAQEAADYSAWCARHGVKAWGAQQGVDDTSEQLAERQDELERQGRLIKLRATPDFLRGLGE